MKQVLGVLAAVGSFVLVLIAMGVGKTVGRSAAEAMTAPDKAEMLEQALLVSAEQMRATLPMQLDAATTMIDVRAYGPEIVYMHRLTGVAAADVTREQMAQFSEQINSKTCANSQTRSLLDNGGVMTYAYRDESGAGIGEFSLSLASCTGAEKPKVALGAVARTERSVAVQAKYRTAMEGVTSKTDQCTANQKEETARVDKSLPEAESTRAYAQINQRFLECLQR